MEKNILTHKFHSKAELFRELMANEIREILLVSSLYNIFNFEEDGSLASKIINEYKGLNLCHPPRISGTSSVTEAIFLLEKKKFDMVIIVPHPVGIDAFSLWAEIKKIKKNLPVIILFPGIREIDLHPPPPCSNSTDRIFVWSGDADLLPAIIKNTEDHLNVEQDTRKANVPVLLLIEDSPEYYSFFLPIIYKEIVTQTQALLEIRLNDKQRFLTMRSRPKILLAGNYEEAVQLYKKYRKFLLCVISDTRLPRNGDMDDAAGIDILSQIKKDIPELPLLLLSSESKNKEKSEKIPSLFLDKNTPNLPRKIRDFLLFDLGFGDFIFRLPDHREIGRASNLLELETTLAEIPNESISHHADCNHFSNWLMARSEINLALKFRSVKSCDFRNIEELRNYIISNIHELRKSRQKGIISKFNRRHFDSDIREFVKIGEGSLGGKARGLAFMANIFGQYEHFQKKYSEINIKIPKTLVICTDFFDSFIERNHLQKFAEESFTDQKINEVFLKAKLPERLTRKLKTFLSQVKYPLSIRSSSQLEGTHFQPYTGLYRTYMIPNNHPNLSIRLLQLIKGIKLVYASTYYRDPKIFYKNTQNITFNNSMAVIIQEVAGAEYGDYFYPTISGVAQSDNFYPFSHMKSDEGIAHIALGFGKTLVDGGKCLRFSPKYPNILPEFSTVEDILKNTQQCFYALKINDYSEDLNFSKYSNLEKRYIEDAENEFPVKTVAGTYIFEENRIRDTWNTPGTKVITFSQILKHNIFPLSDLLQDLMDLGRKSLECPVEIEFSVNLYPDQKLKNEFVLLQIRPLTADKKRSQIHITERDLNKAFCCSHQALGNGVSEGMSDIVYVKSQEFKAESTIQIVHEINRINASLLEEKRSYLLVGPGRWGSSDKCLGIPVKWRNISGVGAIVELRNGIIHADASQGSHFFHHITSLGIHYITINESKGNLLNSNRDYFDLNWVSSLPAVSETSFMRHVRLERPITLKTDGRKSSCVMIKTI